MRQPRTSTALDLSELNMFTNICLKLIHRWDICKVKKGRQIEYIEYFLNTFFGVSHHLGQFMSTTFGPW